MAGSFGSEVERREDAELVAGEGEYTDDIYDPRMAYIAILRSQYGHARIEDVDTAPAEEYESVIDVFTAADIVSSGVEGTIGVQRSLPNPDGVQSTIREELRTPPQTLLASDRVRYQGEPIAVVIAEDRYTAHDAVDRIDVDYERLEAVIEPTQAIEASAPTLHESVSDNVAFDWEVGTKRAVDDAFDAADHTVAIELGHQRVSPTPMEPRATVATYNQHSQKLTLKVSTQIPHMHRTLVSETLGIPENKIQVITPDVGGGFGGKMNDYSAELVVAWCATQVDRPVKWQATRTEAFMSDFQGRGHETVGELALTKDGTFVALQAHSYADIGAYISRTAPTIMTDTLASFLSGQYAIPTIYCRITGVYTNVVPIGPYRGTSRPQAILLLERLVHAAAQKFDFDPVDLRRRNFIESDAFPYQTAVGTTYDSGDYAKTLDRALDLVEYTDIREKQSSSPTNGARIGIGVACSIDEAGSPHIESGKIRIHPGGTVTAYCGTSDHGQGHETTYAQIIGEELGIPQEDIEIIEGDTDMVPQGTGTFASRSAFLGGNALAESADQIVDKGRKIAAQALEASEADIDFDDGEFFIKGAPSRSLTLQAVAERSYEHSTGSEPGLEATAFYDAEQGTFPFSTHIAVVEVDPESGELDIKRYVSVDDCGNQINPLIVEGQIHGGIAQGIGQALYEDIVYDDNGTLLTGSMQDYAVPKVAHIPDLKTDYTITPSPTNPLGVKGVAEAGTIAAPAAISNAVMDALHEYDIEHIDLPITAEKIWRAVNDDR